MKSRTNPEEKKPLPEQPKFAYLTYWVELLLHMSFILYFSAEKAEVLTDTLFKGVQYFLHRIKVLNDKGGLANFKFFLGFWDVRNRLNLF